MYELSLIQVMGNSNASDLHSDNKTIALASGSLVIAWDTLTGQKKYFVGHENEVSCIIFSRNPKYMFSADNGFNPSIGLWNIGTGSKVTMQYFPYKQRQSPIKSILMKENNIGGTLLVIENEYKGYRITCWDTAKVLTMHSVSELENIETCLGIFFLSQNLEFATVEQSCIKIWNYENNIYKNSKKLTFSQPIVQAIQSPLTNFIIALNKFGKVVIVNHEVNLK